MTRALNRFAALTVTEAKLFLRQPAAAFFQLAFPVLLLVLFGSMFGHFPLGEGTDLRVIDFYLPALIGAFVGQSGIVSLPVFLSNYRELGILKRFHATPVSLQTYLSAHIAVQFGALVFMALTMTVVAELLFDVTFLGNVLSVIVVGFLATAGVFACGFALSGVISTPQTGQAVGNFLFLSMFFISGAAIPREMFPDWLATISWASPLTHVVEALSGVWLGDALSAHWTSLLVMAAFFPIGVVIARYTFRWQD